jgi:hypothetical protein
MNNRFAKILHDLKPMYVVTQEMNPLRAVRFTLVATMKFRDSPGIICSVGLLTLSWFVIWSQVTILYAVCPAVGYAVCKVSMSCGGQCTTCALVTAAVPPTGVVGCYSAL